MPCLFMRNVPEGTHFNSVAVEALYREIEGVIDGKVEVHIENTQYKILTPVNTLIPAEVHVFVEWYTRPFRTKKYVATIISDFFKAHNMDCDITFRDSPPGTFFVNGELVGQPPKEYFTTRQKPTF